MVASKRPQPAERYPPYALTFGHKHSSHAKLWDAVCESIDFQERHHEGTICPRGA